MWGSAREKVIRGCRKCKQLASSSDPSSSPGLCPPGPISVPERLCQGQPASAGLYSPFSWAGHPPASDLLEGGVAQLDAQRQQWGPHRQPQRGPQPAPPEIHSHPASAPALPAGHKHCVTGLGHLLGGQGADSAREDGRGPESAALTPVPKKRYSSACP